MNLEHVASARILVFFLDTSLLVMARYMVDIFLADHICCWYASACDKKKQGWGMNQKSTLFLCLRKLHGHGKTREGAENILNIRVDSHGEIGCHSQFRVSIPYSCLKDAPGNDIQPQIPPQSRKGWKISGTYIHRNASQLHGDRWVGTNK